MINLGVFLYESGISMAVLYLFYWFLLRKETHFTLNRIILVGSLILALVLPFLKITFPANQSPGTVIYILDRYIIDDLVIKPEAHVSGLQFNITILSVIWAIYFLGVFIFSARFVNQLLQVVRMIKRYGVIEYQGQKIVPVAREVSPFSFMHLIFMNIGHAPHPELANILQHEREHIRRLHTLDIIILEILCVFQWFNPFVWLYKHAVREVHEYEADRGVIITGENKVSYQQLILQQVFGNQFFQMVHHLIDHSLIKKRITMLTKKETKKRTLLKSMMMLPIAGLLVVVFSFTKVTLSPEGNGQFIQFHAPASVPDSPFILPLPAKTEYIIAAPFGNMLDPFTKKVRHHSGIDISAPAGTTVYAVQAGKIKKSAFDDGYGNTITIVHEDGYVTRYAHLDELLVREGQLVDQGTMIGTVGNTGKSTGPHLHFEIQKDGKYLDPLNLISVHGSSTVKIHKTGNQQDTTRKIVVEEMPVFEGNESHDFKIYIKENLKYPEEAKKEEISGTVYVRFVIDKMGKVSDVEIVRSVHPELDAEALRVIESSPDWKPGRNEGQAVEVNFTIPISFNLNGTEKNGKGTPPVFFVVEEMPEFQGSSDIMVFRNWVTEHLEYPKEAVEKKLEGRVIVSFIVTETGNVSDVNVERGADSILDREACRVIASSPNWKPGRQRGVNVNVAMTIPISFALK